MKRKLLNFVLTFTFLQIFNNGVYSQTVIDYSAFSSTACNTFASLTNVNSIPHLTSIGQPNKASTGEALKLSSSVGNGSQFNGTEYRVTYNFKKGYSYKITANAMREKTGTTGANILWRTDLNNGGGPNNPSCNGMQFIGVASSGNLKQSLQIYNDTYLDYNIQYNTLSTSQSYLMIGVIPSSGMSDQTMFIKKITILETAPELVLSPATLPTTCGVSTTQTFTVSNPSGIDGITSYEWNLGAASNGWLYNGSPASQNITTTTNSISLTSVCNATTVRNVGVTIKVNNVNYKSYTSTITREVQLRQ